MARLRVGVLIDSLQLYAWENAMLKRIVESVYADLVVVVVRDSAEERTTTALDPKPASTSRWTRMIGAALLDMYRALEARIECPHDAFELLHGTSTLDGVPVMQAATSIPARPLLKEEQTSVPLQGEGAGAAAGGSDSVDVFINLCASEPGARFTEAARYGVWSLKHAHCRTGDAAAAGFWPVCKGWPIIESQVEMTKGADAHRMVLARSVSGTNRFSVKLNRSALYWKTSSLLPRKLEELHRIGPIEFFSAARLPMPSSTRIEVFGRPAAHDLALYLLRNIRCRARDFVSRNFELDRWILLFHHGSDLSTNVGEFRKIIPPRDRYWADPHVVKRDGRYYVFLEEFMFDTGKGHIAVLALDDSGNHDGTVRVLEREYHLSYPCVFEHEGGLFMIPESSANRSVDLYRCVDFPSKWEFVETLLKDILAVDATILHHHGRWWLFANTVENEGASFCEELSLFHSDSLLKGKWTPHVSNPLISDVRKSRPAGAIIRRSGEIYRPAQDCSIRYGYAMTVNRITTMSADEYAETPVESVSPDWDRSIVATHTLAYTPGLTVIDALQPRLRIA